MQRLEKIDPTKMTHEEQLCFWINIHNALVMHVLLYTQMTYKLPSAVWMVNLRNQISFLTYILPCDIQAFLAYGIHDKRLKSTAMILKVHSIA